jgi:quercetin dioxygenase-like cupin family protein
MQRNEFLTSAFMGTLALVAPRFSSQIQATDELKPFYLPPLPPLEPGPGGANGRALVRSKQTNNQFSCFESVLAAKKMGPPPHLHKALDEVCFVLEGTASILVGKTVYEVQAGGFHLRPRGIVHTFWNATDKPVRFIDMFFNQNFEDYLEEVRNLLTSNPGPPSPDVLKRIGELDKQYGVTVFPELQQEIMAKYGLR